MTTVRLPGGRMLTIDHSAAATAVRAARQRAAAKSSAAGAAVRTMVQLPADLHMALRRSALNEDTTMGKLVRAAIEAGLQAPTELAAESLPYRRTKVDVRTTVDLPRGLHRTLKVLASEHGTTAQALILAAVLRSQ